MARYLKMFMSNWKRWKKLVLSYSNTRRLYRVIQGLIIFLIISIIIAFFINQWSENKLVEQKNNLFGSWDEVFVNVDVNDLPYFYNHAFIEDYAIQAIQQRALLGDKRLIIGSCSDNFVEIGNIKIKSGRLPEKEGEVAIEEEYLSILGVNKVGDKIPSSVNIPALSNYSVCGIIYNYSSVWNLVNKDVRYINCFTYECDQNKMHIFVKGSKQLQQDLEKNFINYKTNIQIENGFIFNDSFGLFFVIGIYILIMIIKLCKFTAQYIEISGKCEKNKKYLNQKCRSLNIVILNILSAILIICIMNNIVYENYFNKYESLLYNMNFDKKIYNLYLDLDSYSFLQSIKFDGMGTKTSSLYISKQYEQILDTSILVLWLVLVNWLSMTILLNKTIVSIYNDIRFYLNNYYFGFNTEFLNEKTRKIYSYLLLQFFIIILFIMLKQLFYWRIIKVLILVLVINGFNFYVNHKIIIQRIKYIENDSDWMLIKIE